MIFVSEVSKVKGQVISNENPYVKILSEPKCNNGQWTALAQVEGMLAIVELKVTLKN